MKEKNYRENERGKYRVNMKDEHYRGKWNMKNIEKIKREIIEEHEIENI